MYGQIERHTQPLLDLLRRDGHVQKYDELMRAFRASDSAIDEKFQTQYAGFWRLRSPDRKWRPKYFKLLETLRGEARTDLATLLRRICRETHGERGGVPSVEFSFASKLAHTVVPDRAPIYDARVKAFYFLPDAPRTGDIESRINHCLEVYEAVAREYARIFDRGLLTKSIGRFKRELAPQEFTDVKIIDSLIWAFVTWAMGNRKRSAALLGGTLEYE